MSDTPAPTPTEGTARRKPPPNYAARRMLVTTVGIMAVVAFAVVGWTVVRGDDDSAGGSAGSWSQIAMIVRSCGAVTGIDDEGEVVETIVGRGRVTDVHTIGKRMALVGARQIVLEGDGQDAQTIPIDRNDVVTPLRTADTLHLIVGPRTGGNVVIVDVTSGATLDIGAIAGLADPLLFAETLKAAADGNRYAVADAKFFRTVVVEFGVETAAFFAAQPIALDGDRLATSQVINRQADIALFDRDRKNQALVPAPIPAGGVMIENNLLMVATDGGIYRIEGGSTEAERLGEVAVPSGASVDAIHPSLDGTRLVVVGSVFQAVIDLEGRTLFTTTFTTPVDVSPPSPAWSCLPVGGDDSFHSLVSLDTGDQLADLSGVVVIGTASDGCTVMSERTGVTEVITADGSVVLGRVRAAALGPDGRTVVRTLTDGTTELVRIDDDLTIAEPLDLTAVSTAGTIVAYLD